MVRKILHEWVAGEKTLPEAVADWRRKRTRAQVVTSVGYILGQGVVVSLLLDAAAGWWFTLLREVSSMSWTEAVGLLLLGIVTVQLAVLLLDVRRIAERIPPRATAAGCDPNRGEVVESTETSKRRRVEPGDESNCRRPGQGPLEDNDT